MNEICNVNKCGNLDILIIYHSFLGYSIYQYSLILILTRAERVTIG